MQPRFLVVCILFGALVAGAARTAQAAPDATKVQTQRAAPPSAGGRSGGPSSGETSPGAIDADQALAQDTRLNGDRGERIWGISAAFESHVAVVQTEPDNLRTRPDKLYNYLVVSPTLYPSKYDQVRVDLGAYQYFTGDQNESGLRLADVVGSYTRFIPIATEEGNAPSVPPMRGLLLRAEGDVTAPTSFSSQLRGIVTVPRLRLYLERAFLDHSLIVGVNGFGEHYFVRYYSAEGGSPNTSNRVAAEATVDYRLPFYKPVSFGVLVDTSYSYYYNAHTAAPPVNGIVGDATYPTQPPQQRYGAEARVRYAFPVIGGIGGVRTAASIAYSLGDNTVLHDGVQHLNFAFYRRASEVYATLSARY